MGVSYTTGVTGKMIHSLYRLYYIVYVPKKLLISVNYTAVIDNKVNIILWSVARIFFFNKKKKWVGGR